MSRIIRVIIQNSFAPKQKTERRLTIERFGKYLISLFLTSILGCGNTLLESCRIFKLLTLSAAEHKMQALEEMARINIEKAGTPSILLNFKNSLPNSL